MEISRKTDYALRMISSLLRSPHDTVSVRVAAEDNGIPYAFARTIQHDLARAGLVECVRGSKGGMRLAVDPRGATLLEVVEAIQGPVRVCSCDGGMGGDEPCPLSGGCALRPIWCGARTLLADYLSSVTILEALKDGSGPIVPDGDVSAPEEGRP